MKGTAIAFVLFLFFALNTSAQTEIVDSLKTEIENYRKQGDLEKQGINWINLSKAYYKAYEDSLAIAAVDSAIKVFTKQNNTKKLAYALHTKAGHISDFGDNETGVGLYLQAIEKAKEVKYDTLLSYSLNNLGLVYKDLGKYKEAVEVLYEALELKERIGMPEKSIASALLNLGHVLDNLGKSEDAIKYYQRSYELRKKLGDKLGMARVLANIAVIYKNQEKYDKAAELIGQSNAILAENPDDALSYVNYTNLGNLSKKFGDNAAALKNLNLALASAQKMNDANKIGDANLNMGGYYQDLGDYKKSVGPLEKALEITDFTKSFEQLRDIHLMLSQAYGQLNETKKAYDNLQLSNQYRDSIYKMEEIRAIEELKTQYETEKKEKELAQTEAQLSKEQLKVRKRNNWLTIFGSGILLILVSGGFFVRQQRLKQEKLRQKADLDLQNERLRISRDLHDHIGAELTLISSSLDKKAFQSQNEEEKKEMEGIGDYARGAMSQLRETIWAIHGETVKLEDFAIRLREYGNKMTEAKDIKFKVDVSGEDVVLGPAKTINLYRICQEAINNAIKYSGCDEISVSLRNGGQGKLTLGVFDNGNGFDVSTAKKGYGLQNMKQRAEELGGSFTIESEKEKGTGIIVRVNA